MRLLTQEIIDALPPLYSTERIPLKEKIVICKFFATGTYWSWYVFEGEKNETDNDFKFFGMVHGHEKEMGYFLLSELEGVYLPIKRTKDGFSGFLGIKVERDLSVFKVPYKKLILQESQNF